MRKVSFLSVLALAFLVFCCGETTNTSPGTNENDEDHSDDDDTQDDEDDDEKDDDENDDDDDDDDNRDEEKDDKEDTKDEKDPIPIETVCGDGILTEDEACDDGNTESDDGCADDCQEVAEGWLCYPPGFLCHPVVRCGDGMRTPPELCDDGNQERGDGCNDLCQVEIGYKCSDESPSECSETTCGDGEKEGAEGCDDKNTMPFDGCSTICMLEPDCEDGGNCTSSCGDGMVIDEECDDGNNVDGDGCSAECEQEDGYECTIPDADGEFIEVPIILKDFLESDVDFEPGLMFCDIVSEGMVEDELGPDGKPVAAPFETSEPEDTDEADTDDEDTDDEDTEDVVVGPVQPTRDLSECGRVEELESWYDNSDQSDPAVVVDSLILFNNGEGGYVNRADEEGNQWAVTQGGAQEYIDGEPHFFPMDQKGITPEDEYAIANTAPPYDSRRSDEDDATERAGVPLPDDYSFEHNFHFTSEVRFWFKYDESITQTFNFLGDDDVWVFINNKLVVDLGGIHAPMEGEVVINDLDLEDGKVYEIAVFQAERQFNGSSYRLTLSGFVMARSECRSICGDGIIALGEECDDGENDGGYGECDENCKLGAYCGDGVVQEEFGENCDDGNFSNGDGCPSSCRHILIE